MAENQTFTLVATENISAYTVVAVINGQAVPADSGNLEHMGNVVGIALGGALAGANVIVQYIGRVTFNGWNWAIDNPIFLRSHGMTSQGVPATGFIQSMGEVLTSTSFLVKIGPPVEIH